MGAYSTLNEFISYVRTKGIPTASHYYVMMPAFPGYKEVGMLCDSAVIPGLNIMTGELRTAGEASEMPHGVTYQPATLSFLIDNTFDTRKYFEVWMNSVYNTATRSLGYYNEYQKDIHIVVNDKAGKDIFQITLHEAYPKSINDVALSYSNHEVMHVDVTMVFKYWTREGVNFAGGGRGNVNPQSVTPETLLGGIAAGKNLTGVPGGASTALGGVASALGGVSGGETLGNTGSGAVSAAIGGLSGNPASSLLATGNSIASGCMREGKAALAILSTSGLTAPADSNFGGNLGSVLGKLGSVTASFGNAVGGLSGSLTAVMGPVVAISSSVGSMASTIGSIDSLLSTVGIKTNLGKISKDMGGLAGQLSSVTTLKGIPSKLGAVGANMNAVGGSLNNVMKALDKFPSATAQAKRAVGAFGDVFAKKGSEVSDTSANLETAVDKGAV